MQTCIEAPVQDAGDKWGVPRAAAGRVVNVTWATTHNEREERSSLFGFEQMGCDLACHLRRGPGTHAACRPVARRSSPRAAAANRAWGYCEGSKWCAEHLRRRSSDGLWKPGSSILPTSTRITMSGNDRRFCCPGELVARSPAVADGYSRLDDTYGSEDCFSEFRTALSPPL